MKTLTKFTKSEEEIESTYDLYWDCDYNLKGWNCLCSECYEEEGGEPLD